jgi:hypothetical protein
MEKTPPLQMTDVVAWGKKSTRERLSLKDRPHYATAVRACESLYSIHRPIDKDGLANFHWREEGYAAIDPQRKQREEAMDRKKASEEFKRFEKMMRRLKEKAAKTPKNK